MYVLRIFITTQSNEIRVNLRLACSSAFFFSRNLRIPSDWTPVFGAFLGGGNSLVYRLRLAYEIIRKLIRHRFYLSEWNCL